MSAILQSYAKVGAPLDVCSLTAQKTFKQSAMAYEPEDPYYETVVDEHGRAKRHKRDVPPGLSKRDAKALRKIRRRAHYLDKGINLCGFRVGWTFFIGESGQCGPRAWSSLVMEGVETRHGRPSSYGDGIS